MLDQDFSVRHANSQSSKILLNFSEDSKIPLPGNHPEEGQDPSTFPYSQHWTNFPVFFTNEKPSPCFPQLIELFSGSYKTMQFF